MSLILNTPAALEEYNNRVLSAKNNLKNEIIDNITPDNVEYYAELNKKHQRLEDLEFQIKIALNNPKLNMSVLIDDDLLYLIVSL